MAISSDPDKYKFSFDKDDIYINPEWLEKPSYLRGDLAIIEVPQMKTDEALKPIRLPQPLYYPNGI